MHPLQTLLDEKVRHEGVGDRAVVVHDLIEASGLPNMLQSVLLGCGSHRRRRDDAFVEGNDLTGRHMNASDAIERLFAAE